MIRRFVVVIRRFGVVPNAQNKFNLSHFFVMFLSLHYRHPHCRHGYRGLDINLDDDDDDDGSTTFSGGGGLGGSINGSSSNSNNALERLHNADKKNHLFEIDKIIYKEN